MTLLGDIITQAFGRRPCWRKQGWPSRGAAAAQMRSLLERGLSKDPARLNAYQCQYCGEWHVGHSSREEGPDASS